MAADDSSTSDNKEPFGYGRSTPPPTTSSISKKQESGDAKTVAEPDKEEKEKFKIDKDDIDLPKPDANPDYNPDEKTCCKDENKISKDNSDRDKDSIGDKDRPGKDLNGSDKLDGQWIPPKDDKPSNDDDDEGEEDEESCTVKCLYYTMQCCECTIS